MKLILVITALVKSAENFTFRLWNSSHFNGSITWFKYHNQVLQLGRVHFDGQTDPFTLLDQVTDVSPSVLMQKSINFYLSL